MVTQNEVVAVVEGPQGKAEILETPDATGRGVQYEVRFQGEGGPYEAKFPTMGEAYITAKEKAGVKG
ncbi:MAG TPA: hypothetical protein VNN21_11670 [Dehalococcoidia bacterium]|nr:hypothetical protein [Dehalococcoidia bacterium]